MNTEILNLILETLQAQEKKNLIFQDLIETQGFKMKCHQYTINQLSEKNKVYEDLIETQRFRLNELEYTINQLTKDLATHENSIQDIENIDIEDELRNSYTFTELEEKVLELEEPQGYVSEIGPKSFMESNREELDGLNNRITGIEKMIKAITIALNK